MSGGAEDSMKIRTILIMVAVLAGLAASYFIFKPPRTEPPVETKQMVWSVEMMELTAITVSLPAKEKSEAWTKHDDKFWYFDKPDGPKVDMQRWGGGIPLLLSGPAADRLITEESTDEQLEIYGLADPNMEITLGLENGDIINIEVGDVTPAGQTYYVKLANSRHVYTVDYSWYDVFERLVLDPPYPKSPAE